MTRTDEFNEGGERARMPQFRSVQQQSNRIFEAKSVLDNVIPNQNGLGSADLQRHLVGQASSTGSAESTFDKQMWLRNRPATARYQEYNNG